MDHGEQGRRSKPRVLDRSPRLVNEGESPEKFTSIHKLIAYYEAVWEKLRGGKVRVIYRSGFYYLGSLKWTRSVMEGELIKLVKEEQQLNQLGGIKL